MSLMVATITSLIRSSVMAARHYLCRIGRVLSHFGAMTTVDAIRLSFRSSGAIHEDIRMTKTVWRWRWRSFLASVEMSS